MRFFVYVVMSIVSIAILSGFFIAGSPMEERVRKFDARRVEHLQMMQSQILNYWMNKERLPERLSDLRDDISGFVEPKDPETGAEYGYEIKGKNIFSLCAVFSRMMYTDTGVSKPVMSEFYSVGQNWDHDAGNVCFERTIDEELYKPREKS